MLKRMLMAAMLGGAVFLGQGAAQAQAGTSVHVSVAIGGVPVYYPVHYAPPVHYVPPRRYVPVYYKPRWKWRCRKRVKRVRFWHRGHGHWHVKTVRKRVCHRVRVW